MRSIPKPESTAASKAEGRLTLIVGIKCTDGVVLGADGAATLGVMGTPTVRQAVKKLTIIDRQVVVGVSGPVGLAQRFTNEVEALWTGGKLSGKTGVQSMVDQLKVDFLLPS